MTLEWLLNGYGIWLVSDWYHVGFFALTAGHGFITDGFDMLLYEVVFVGFSFWYGDTEFEC